MKGRSFHKLKLNLVIAGLTGTMFVDDAAEALYF
jgi:hypothetical protein